jgi:hypothetical protein
MHWSCSRLRSSVVWIQPVGYRASTQESRERLDFGLRRWKYHHGLPTLRPYTEPASNYSGVDPAEANYSHYSLDCPLVLPVPPCCVATTKPEDRAISLMMECIGCPGHDATISRLIDPSLHTHVPDSNVIGRKGVLGTVCYTEHGMPAILYSAYKYSDNPAMALKINANLLGDSTSRGALLGAILGVAHGVEVWSSDLVDGLKNLPRFKRALNIFWSEYLSKQRVVAVRPLDRSQL